MPDRPKYYDARARFWQRHFEAAQGYTTYLAASDPAKSQKWHDLGGQIPAVTDGQQRRLTGHPQRGHGPLRGDAGRTMRVLVYSGVWCGDCVRQGPMLQRIAEACGPEVELRLIDRDASAELTDELRILGAMRVPMVVFLSEDWFEVGRFGDRLLTVYRAKAARELGPACDSGVVAPPADQLAAEQEEWVGIFERMLLMLRLSPLLRERYED
jgi:glutaredoxin